MLTISGTMQQTVTITRRELAWTLYQVIFELLGETIDDAGCDWYTDGEHVCIGHEDWIVCDRGDVARLVDAANVLIYGHTLHLEGEST